MIYNIKVDHIMSKLERHIRLIQSISVVVSITLIAALTLLVMGCATDHEKQVTHAETAAVNQKGEAKTTALVSDNTQSDFLAIKTQLNEEIPKIYFNFDSGDVNESYRNAIKNYAEELTKNPMSLVVLEGHADERGSPEYNLHLGLLRADAVQILLLEQGVPEKQIQLKSYGETRPAASGHNEVSWRQNRRVEVLYKNLSHTTEIRP